MNQTVVRTLSEQYMRLSNECLLAAEACRVGLAKAYSAEGLDQWARLHRTFILRAARYARLASEASDNGLRLESKLEAIRRRRAETGEGITEAKAFVDANPHYLRMIPA